MAAIDDVYLVSPNKAWRRMVNSRCLHSCSAVFVILLVISGCGQSERNSPPHAKKVVDYFGKEIFLPEKVDRIVSTSRIVSEYLCVLGARGKLAGITRTRGDEYVFQRLFPGIASLPSVGAKEVSLEKLAAMEPDVVLCNHNKVLIESIERLNIVAVGTFPSSIDGIFDQIRTVGIVANKEAEADTVIRWLRKRLALVEERLRSLNDGSRPGIYYIRHDPFETLGNGIYSEIVNASGGRNVVGGMGEGEVPVIVSLEHICAWNPDVILIRDVSPVVPGDLLSDPKWKDIAAVKQRRIYKEHHCWSEFRVETVFGIMEKAKWLHPDLFMDVDPIKEHEEFFKLVEGFYR
jgi:iron complex transport system substrate-binding protein